MFVTSAVLCAAFIVTFLLIKATTPVAILVGLVDKPGGRKRHQGLIPLIGGIAIFGGVFLSAYIFLDQPLFVRLFMLGGGFLVFMGALDDRYDLSARFRLVGQFLVASIFVYGLESYLSNFGNLLGIGNISIGWLGYPVALLALIGVINAFNMLDGMDGLVGSVALISFVGLMTLFGMAGDITISLLCAAFVGAIGAFLLFNLGGSTNGRLTKIFMGDAGSMFVGLAIGVFLIYGSQGGEAAFKPVSALWFVLLPITDMLTIIYRRVKRGRSPMAPDRTHVHHLLQRAGFTPSQTLGIIILCQSALVAIGVFSTTVDGAEPASFAAAIAVVGLYQLWMKRSWRFIRWNKRRLGAEAPPVTDGSL